MRGGPLTTGELARAMPGLTRFAVMQHLGVLEQAGLVLARKEGRTRLNFSNPSVLRELYDSWVTPLASTAAETTQHLRRYAETRHEARQEMDNENRFVTIEMETRIAAPRSVVWRALTVDYPEWWPHRFREDGVCYHENRVGGTLGEKWPDGGQAAYGTIQWLEPERKQVTNGVGFMGEHCATNTETLEDDGNGGTIYRRSLKLWGKVPESMEQMFRDGSRALMESALKTYCERKAGGAA